MPLGEALAFSLCVPVEASFANEPLAVVDDASPCEPDTKSGVCDSIMAVCEAEVPASFATGLTVPSVLDEAPLSASFGIGLPAEPDEASLCVPADVSGVDGSIEAGGIGFSPAWSFAVLVAVEYESGDP